MSRHRTAVILAVLAAGTLAFATTLILAPAYLPMRTIHTVSFDYLSFYSSWSFLIAEPVLALGAFLLSDRHTRLRRVATVLLSIWVLVVLGSLLIHW